jgi:hypothetical protein
MGGREEEGLKLRRGQVDPSAEEGVEETAVAGGVAGAGVVVVMDGSIGEEDAGHCANRNGLDGDACRGRDTRDSVDQSSRACDDAIEGSRFAQDAECG